MSSEVSISQSIELARRSLNGAASRESRSEIGQFFTPAPIASFMASLFEQSLKHVRILDPGAGIGALFAALIQELLTRQERPESIEVVAYETDESLRPHIEKTLRMCECACKEHGVLFNGIVLWRDFIPEAVVRTEEGLFCVHEPRFSHAILNPPYRKINGDSDTRRALSSAGLETSNLYSAFVWLASRMLCPGGELVAITPRSFCNGPYFRRFRKGLLDLIGLRRFHVFHSRRAAFRDDSVLQENIIFYGVRGEAQPQHLKISVSKGSDLHWLRLRQIPFERVVRPEDPDAFIHLAEDDDAQSAMDGMSEFVTSLEELGLAVSTGRVVDFRMRMFLRADVDPQSVPLLYPCHFSNGFVAWPSQKGKKPNAIALADETRDLLVTSGHYVLTKRFSAKEERRRVVAAVCDPARFKSQWLGFENHLNYFHAQGEGMSANLARGLAVFLNSTVLDRHFRLFSGHTQVNATDLRKMRYPSHDQLLRMGNRVKNAMPDQRTIDKILEEVCGANGQT